MYMCHLRICEIVQVETRAMKQILNVFYATCYCNLLHSWCIVYTILIAKKKRDLDSSVLHY